MLARCIKKGTVQRKGHKNTVWIEPGMIMDVELDKEGNLPHIMEAHEEEVPKSKKVAEKKARVPKDENI